jgi:hypothetical protein
LTTHLPMIGWNRFWLGKMNFWRLYVYSNNRFRPLGTRTGIWIGVLIESGNALLLSPGFGIQTMTIGTDLQEIMWIMGHAVLDRVTGTGM